MEKQKLLIIEDDDDLRTQMKWALAQDYQVLIAEDRKKGLDIIKKENPAVITLDLGLPPNPAGVEEGFVALNEIVTTNPGAKVIIITGQGEKENALRAVAQGAYDFFYKPFEIEELKIVLTRAFRMSQLEKEHMELQQRVSVDSFEGILGTSEQIQQVFALIRKVSTTDVPIMIQGESGTGKELVARAIHNRSSRADEPFVTINCGAIPENLLESELFGHEKGAFTGAHIQRKGRVELANQGTLFLDEIGELSLPLQVKLLRFLQERVIERVGGRQEIEVDARVIAATNRDLKKAMKTGSFREDLYFRLGVIFVSIPPLRERKGDVLLLAKSFMKRYAEENKKILTGFTNHAIEALERYEWAGNVRELENRIKRAVIMAEGKRLTPADLEMETPTPKYGGMQLKEAREAVEKELIKKSLARCRGNVTKAATELGISRPTLYDLIDKFKISTD